MTAFQSKEIACDSSLAVEWESRQVNLINQRILPDKRAQRHLDQRADCCTHATEDMVVRRRRCKNYPTALFQTLDDAVLFTITARS